MKLFADLSRVFAGTKATDVGRWNASPVTNEDIIIYPMYSDYNVLDPRQNMMLAVKGLAGNLFLLHAYKASAIDPFETITVQGTTDIHETLCSFFPEYEAYQATSLEYDAADVRGTPVVPNFTARVEAMCAKLDDACGTDTSALTAQALLNSGKTLTDDELKLIIDNVELTIEEECDVRILNMMFHYHGMTRAECAHDLYCEQCDQLKKLNFPDVNSIEGDHNESLQTVYKLAEMIKVFAELCKEEQA